MIGPEPNGIVGVFTNRFDASTALGWLRVDGLAERDISIISPTSGAARRPEELDHSPRHRREIARYWARWGAVLGGAIGVGPASLAFALGTVGMGPFEVALALGVALTMTTAAIGAIVSALFAVAVHERYARTYERALESGRFVVVVHTDDPAALRDARREFEALGATSIELHGLPFATA